MVPNLFPKSDATQRIALIGEAPGVDEVKSGQPFTGASGKFLSILLARAGTSRESCFVGNVCQTRPDSNEIAAFEWGGDEIQHGIAQLREDLIAYKPDLIVCLGGAPLHLFKTGNIAPRKTKRQGKLVFKWPNSPVLWRGSFFRSTLNDCKALATLHPAYVLRDYEAAPLLQLDLKKAVSRATLPLEKILPKRRFDLNKETTIASLYALKESKQPVAIDIEGGIGTMSCISFALSPEYAFIVTFFDKAGKRTYDPVTEVKVWRLLATVLEDPTIPKILQNSLYDRFVLQYDYGIRVRGVRDDIMLKHWEKYCELEKALDVQASIYTDEPWYKGDRKSQDDKEFFSYCCRDSAVTYEINERLRPMIHGTSLEHYRFNMSLLIPLLYMEMRGIRYDEAKARLRRNTVRQEMFEEQARLNGLTGRFVRGKQYLFDKAREALAYKKALIAFNDFPALIRNAYKDSLGDATRLGQLVNEPKPSLATIGEVEDVIGVSLNVGSPKVMAGFLYDELGLPKQYNVKGRDKEGSLTSDYEALLKLSKHCIREGEKHRLRILTHCINIRSLTTRQRMLGISADKDGRIRCGYNIVGTETGRVSSYESPTGSGYNLQTIPKADRDLFVADDGCYIFQCDLSGADGWTVAAYCAMLGDHTMLDDYLNGLKPAKILTLALHGDTVDFSNREALRESCRKVDPEDWDYFAMKRLQHGCSYVEGPQRVSDQIFTDSEGKFYLSTADCKTLRDKFFFKRYPGIPKWHTWLGARIRERPTLIAASGQVRHFFGRREDLLPKAAAHEPQANTTYATNLALYRLWTDSENCLPEGRLRIEPLHQVHDALIGQFAQSDTTWAVGKIREWFNNKLNIAGQQLVIPFEGSYGESWGKLDEGVI